MLKLDRIVKLLPAQIAEKYAEQIELFAELDSTNEYLLNSAKTTTVATGVCIAETQTAGRGRNNKKWQSPPGSNLYFSQLIQVPQKNTLNGVTLVSGIILCQILREMTELPCLVKWPNDLYIANKKIAGILTEVAVDPKGQRFLVIGIGVNIALPQSILAELPSATDLASHGLIEFDRELLVAKLISNIDQSISSVLQDGWLSYHQLWQQYDLLLDQSIFVKTANQSYQGIAKGVTPEGYLQVEMNGEIKQFSAAEVSISTL